MPVLSNNGRLITSLPISSQASNDDELLIQSNGVTKRIKYSTLKTNFLTGFNPYTSTVDFTAITNKFTGSFKGTSTGVKITLTTNDGIQGGGELTSNRTLSVDSTVVRTSGGQTIAGSKIFSSPIIGNLSGDVTSTGTSTFTTVDINGGAIDGTTIGSSSPSTVIATRITGSIGIKGNVTGSIRGDIYTDNGNKVLENGTSANPGGNVPSAFFYGTSSYANQSLTAAYAAAGGSGGLPGGASQYQVISWNGSSAFWSNSITASNQGNNNYIAVWSGPRTIQNLNNFYYNGGTWNSNVPIIATQFRSLNGTGMTVDNGYGAFTGSYVGYSATVTITSGNPYKKIYGDKESSVFLALSSSGYCTMSLMKGQTATIFIQNSGNYKVLKWSGSLDGGNSANTKIYWKNAQSASITQGDLKKDVITFVNINNKIFGSVINNFQ